VEQPAPQAGLRDLDEQHVRLAQLLREGASGFRGADRTGAPEQLVERRLGIDDIRGGDAPKRVERSVRLRHGTSVEHREVPDHARGQLAVEVGLQQHHRSTTLLQLEVDQRLLPQHAERKDERGAHIAGHGQQAGAVCRKCDVDAHRSADEALAADLDLLHPPQDP
jgi:hypothetical protein